LKGSLTFTSSFLFVLKYISFTLHNAVCNAVSQNGGVAEWLCSGLQSRGRRFDSDLRLQFGLVRSVARVVKLVDTADLKSAAYLNKGRAGSIPAPGTKPNRLLVSIEKFFLYIKALSRVESRLYALAMNLPPRSTTHD
jgi:hypothetical protein